MLDVKYEETKERDREKRKEHLKRLKIIQAKKQRSSLFGEEGKKHTRISRHLKGMFFHFHS